MENNVDKFDNVVLPLLFSTLSIAIRIAHDKYQDKIENSKNYIMRFIIGILFTIVGSFIISKDLQLRGIDLYWTSIFIIGLFGMEISLFLLDKKTVVWFRKIFKNFISDKLQDE
jgi:hypothetical protein